MAKKGGGLPPAHTLLRWPAWALGLLLLGSAFAPMSRAFLSGLHWAAFLFSVLEAGVALAHGRRGALAAYAAIAVLVNPFRVFVFDLQWWRILHAGAGIWLCADHTGDRG